MKLLNTGQPVIGIVMVIQNRMQEIGKILINLQARRQQGPIFASKTICNLVSEEALQWVIGLQFDALNHCIKGLCYG